MQDWQLLRQYVTEGSQAAFSKLVERHLRPIYATCLREVRDPQLAEDVTQAVFLILAKKARAIRPETPLAGWLFNTSRFVSKNALRHEARRAALERKAADEMQSTSRDSEAAWREIDPVLNDAMASLRQTERDIILLRFYNDLSMAETGEALGISEDAAKMRIGRALEKLRRSLAKSGVAVPAVGGLAALLTAHAAEAIPAAIGASLTAALSTITVGGLAPVGAGITIITEGAIRAMWITKIKAAATIIGACVIGGSAVGVVAHTYGPGRGTLARIRTVATVAPTATVAENPAVWRQRGDPKAVQLLDQMTAAYKKLSTFSVTADTSMDAGVMTHGEIVNHLAFAFARPNKISIKPIPGSVPASQPHNMGVHQYVYDGTNVYREMSDDGRGFYKDDIPDHPLTDAFSQGNFQSALNGQLTEPDSIKAICGDNSGNHESIASITLGDPGSIDGVPVDTVVIVGSDTERGQQFAIRLTIAIGKSDHLLRRTTDTMTLASGKVYATQSETHRDVKINPQLPESVFVYDQLPGDKDVNARPAGGPTGKRKITYAIDPMTRDGSAILSGRITFEDGKPAEGIKVKATMTDSSRLPLRGGNPQVFAPERLWKMCEAEGISGADGTYHLKGLTDGQYNVTVDAPSGQWIASPILRVPAAEGKTVAMGDIVLSSGILVTGTVTDKATGKPVDSAVVDCFNFKWQGLEDSICKTSTDHDGRYRLRVLPGQSHLMCFPGSSYGRELVNINILQGEPVTQDFQAERKGVF